MRLKLNFLLVAIMLLCSNSYCQGTQTFEARLKKFGTNEALIIPSQAIDEFPIWSCNSEYIGFNLMGKWYKTKLDQVELAKGNWRRGKRIAVIQNRTEEVLLNMNQDEVEIYKKCSKSNPRKVLTKDGIIIELKLEGFTTSLIITKKGGKPKIFWTSEMENCHSLTLSPDEKFVAYICEMNGLIIRKIK